jgi:hypothetical protein
MPLLPPNVSYRPDSTPLFASATGAAPIAGIVTAQGFVATGAGAPGGVGTFTAAGNGLPGGIDMFNMTQSAGTLQWSTGMAGVPAGANSGNNYALFGYDDNGGFLNQPILVERASGGVTMVNGLTIGNPAIVGGGLLEIDGTLGLGTVYDTLYNPAVASQTAFAAANNAVVPNAPAPGTNTVPLGGTFTVPRSGMYILTGLLSYDGAVGTTFTAASEDFFTVNCNPSPPSPGSGFGGVTVSLTNATAVDRAWEATATLLLTAGIPYQANLILQNNSGTVAATGAAVLNGSFDLVALC